MNTLHAVLVITSLAMSTAALVFVRSAREYQRKAQANWARVDELREEARKLRIRDEAAIDVVHEWQREGDPNEYLTRVHRALRPPVSGSFKSTGTSQ